MSKEESSDKVPTYWHYLDLEQLLSLQGGLEDDEANLMPDELHFIIVHQTLELWFKLMLSELRLARNHLDAAEVPEQHIPHVVHHMGRIIEILKLAVQQFDVVETLTARDFLAFRDKLFPASGFQSFQLREIEILLGLEESKRAKLGKVSALKYLKDLAPRSTGGHNAWSRIEQAQSEVTLLSALEKWLYRTPSYGSSPSDPGDEKVVEEFLTDYLKAWTHRANEQMAAMIETKAAPEEAVRKHTKTPCNTWRPSCGPKTCPKKTAPIIDGFAPPWSSSSPTRAPAPRVAPSFCSTPPSNWNNVYCCSDTGTPAWPNASLASGGTGGSAG